MIDTHTHLYSEQFASEMPETIRRAIESGVTRMILPGIHSKYIKTQLELRDNFPDNILLACGLHPTDVKDDFEDELKIVDRELETGKYCAVGEIGIDLYWDKTFFESQKKAFIAQIEFAKKYKLPIIIHARDAFSEIFEIMDAHIDSNLTGVFHSFTGTVEDAKKIQTYPNFKIGINGIVTFKNSGLDKVVAEIPKELIVLETDSPYLAPVPKRGKRNESAYLPHIAQKIADIYQISLNELVDLTDANAKSLFNI